MAVGSDAWRDVELLLSPNVSMLSIPEIYVRLQTALAALRASWLGLACLTAAGCEYLGLPYEHATPFAWPER